jgi:hypothetical protein
MKRLAGLLSLTLIPAPFAAQQTVPDAPLATVERLFDGMRRRDTAAMHALFDSTARLVTTSNRNGQPVMRVASIERWLQAVGSATQELDERIWDAEVRVDDNLATVWVKYEFLAGGEFSHCGVDAFQLFKGPAGWKIVQVTDTQRRENCWHKPPSP